MEIASSFSVGRLAYNHDVRVGDVPKNVTKERIPDDVVLVDVRQGRSLEATIDEIMQPYIDEYNSKQKRKDRRIEEGYCDYWKKNDKLNKGQLCYEAVMQFGEHETNGAAYYQATGENKERQIKIYTRMYQEGLEQFQKEFPHLKVLWATIHFDEEQGTPHMHIAFVPIGENYKQGMSHQVSIGNALACDGIERLETRKEGLEGGFQLKRAYEKIHHEICNPILQRYFKDVEIKKEMHGLVHQDQRTWFADREEKLLEENKGLKDENKTLKEENKTLKSERITLQAQIIDDRNELAEMAQNKTSLIKEIFDKVKELLEGFRTQEQRQERLERSIHRVGAFGMANKHKERFYASIDEISVDKEPTSLYKPLKDATRHSEAYTSELDYLESASEETIEDLEL